MNVAVITVCSVTFLLFTLTRRVYIKIKKEKRWRVELHFTLWAFHIEKVLASENKKGKKNKRNKKKHSVHYYREVASRISEVLTYSDVKINKLHVPKNEREEYERQNYTGQYGYHGLISAFLAFIKSRSRQLDINDNAIILIPDGEKLSLDMTVSVRLFRIIPTILTFIFTERFMKGKRKYVGK